MKWLVKNTSIREKLGGRDGERSLLHAAAKYGKVRNDLAGITIRLNIIAMQHFPSTLIKGNK